MTYGTCRRGGSGLDRHHDRFDKDANLVRAIARAFYFYKHESCGQCTPCREAPAGCGRVMERMVTGEAEMAEIDMLLGRRVQVEGHTISAWAMRRPADPGLFRHFRHEVGGTHHPSTRPANPHVQGATLQAAE